MSSIRLLAPLLDPTTGKAERRQGEFDAELSEDREAWLGVNHRTGA